MVEFVIRPSRDITIAHISDLHLSSSKALDAFGILRDDIKNSERKPDIIVATGDLADNPDYSELTQAKRALDYLCSDCKIDPTKSLFVVPGNHDYRHWGCFNYRGAPDPFNKLFPNWAKPGLLQFDNFWVAVLPFDSNTNNPKINLATGRVGEKHYAQPFQDLEELVCSQFNHGESGIVPTISYKIALLHHHPMPVADTEVDRLLDKQAFLCLEDAGTFMREMLERRVNLILHGHKHCPNISHVRLLTSKDEEREVTIVGAGSASKPDVRTYGNSYNLITIKKSGKVTVSQLNRYTGATFRRPKERPIRTYDQLRAELFEKARARAETYVDSFVRHGLIDERGDVETLLEYNDFSVTPQGGVKTKKDIELKTIPGTIRAVRAESKSSHISCTWKPAEDSTDKWVKGSVVFSRAVESEVLPMSFKVSYKNFNAFALTKEQKKRMYGSEGQEWMLTAVKEPMGRLRMVIQFQTNHLPKNLHLTVEGIDSRKRDTNEEEWCQDRCYFSPIARTAVLDVDRPLVGYLYKVCWDLPSEAEVLRQNLDPMIEGQTDSIVKKLCGLRQHQHPPLATNHWIQVAMSELLNSIEAHVPLSPYNETREINLMAFDDCMFKIRHIAGKVPDHCLPWVLFEGEGVAGRSHKLNQAHLYIRRRTNPLEDWYIKPPAGEPHEVVLSIPIRHPPTKERNAWVVGVVSIASVSPGSSLVDLYTDKSKVDELIDLTYKHYCEKILPSLCAAG